jgi:hypothetical protein
MQRREFIAAAVGTAAAVAWVAEAFAANGYPDFGAIKKIPAGEGEGGAAKNGMIEL